MTSHRLIVRFPKPEQLHCGDFGKAFKLEVLRDSTDNFSDERLLGEGGFGRVYKAQLQSGDMIAVKKFSSAVPGINDKQFENEARHLTMLKHPNIVQLVGYCSHTEKVLVPYEGRFVYAEKRERLLCLEYLPKGSLHGHLSDESSGLDWGIRYKIIEGICYGLHYLHEKWQASTPIIHMDLKPKNILLDDNMVPKIADFGLSRLFGEEQTRTCTTSRHGTFGYMAPEYFNKGLITKKLDIFSLGVIIIEIMTGRREYPDETETSSNEFMELVLKNWRNRLEKAPRYTSTFSLFPSLHQEIDYRQIRRCIQIGLACVKLDRTKRPTTLEIMDMLHRLEGAECSNGREEEANGHLYNKVAEHTDGTQNYGSSEGKKRVIGEGIDPAKGHQDLLEVNGGEPRGFSLELDDMKFEIAKITERGGLPNAEAVEKLVHLMLLDQTEKKINIFDRLTLADVIAATENPSCLGIFVHSRGLSVLNYWIEEAHERKSGDGSSPIEADKEELLLAVLRALAILPIDFSALQNCSIGKSVNHLRSHRNLEIQKKAKCVVVEWKKRIDAEMKSNDAKPLMSRPSRSIKRGFHEISNAGNKQGGSWFPQKKKAVHVSSSKV
ncbi:unnamed protein product [Urochloa humidicola]